MSAILSVQHQGQVEEQAHNLVAEALGTHDIEITKCTLIPNTTTPIYAVEVFVSYWYFSGANREIAFHVAPATGWIKQLP